MDARREAKKRARALREEFRDRGEFTQADYRVALAGRLRDLANDLFDTSVDKIADDVDRESIRDPEPDSPTLPGFDLDGEYRCGASVRIAKRLARLDHADMAMAIDDTNLKSVLEANVRKREELTRLRPFWGQGMTKAAAVAAYQAENPPPQGSAV